VSSQSRALLVVVSRNIFIICKNDVILDIYNVLLQRFSSLETNKSKSERIKIGDHHRKNNYAAFIFII